MIRQIADRELAQRKDVEEKLDYISRQLRLLEIMNRLPDAGVQPDVLVNRSADVFSVSLMYLAVHIRHESNQLGVLGNSKDATVVANQVGSIAMNIVVGDEALTSVEVQLGKAVEEFNSTLSHFTSCVVFQTFEIGSQTLDAVQGKFFGSMQVSNDIIGLRQDFTVSLRKYGTWFKREIYGPISEGTRILRDAKICSPHYEQNYATRFRVHGTIESLSMALVVPSGHADGDGRPGVDVQGSGPMGGGGHVGGEGVGGQESGAGRTASVHADGDGQPGVDLLESGPMGGGGHVPTKGG